MPSVKADVYKRMQIYRSGDVRLNGAFACVDDFMAAWYVFMEDIKKEDYQLIPTYSDFARWAGISIGSVYTFLEANPDVRVKLREPVADCIVEGGLRKKYEGKLAIFVLKNRCLWTEKNENTNIAADKRIATEEEAEKKIREALKVFNRGDEN